MIEYIWHGFNLNHESRRKQCYYEWNCLSCFLRLCFLVIKLGMKYRFKEVLYA